MKFSGENVFVVGEEDGMIRVHRARITRDGLEYCSEYFMPNALETVEANIDREFAEVIYRQKLMKAKLDEEQDINMELGFGADDKIQ